MFEAIKQQPAAFNGAPKNFFAYDRSKILFSAVKLEKVPLDFVVKVPGRGTYTIKVRAAADGVRKINLAAFRDSIKRNLNEKDDGITQFIEILTSQALFSK